MVAAPKPMPVRLATAEDRAALGEDARVEIIGGAVVAMAPPTWRHGNASLALGSLLQAPFQRGRGGPGGWWIAIEVDIELFAHEVYRPDIAGWRRERAAEPTDEWPTRVRPDWICEVLSPSTAANDVGAKLATYHRAGVAHYWLLDPTKQHLTVLRRAADGYEVVLEAGRGDVVRAEPFDAIEIAVADLFA